MFQRHLAIAGAELRLLEPHHAEVVFPSVDANREMLRRRLPWVNATREVADTRAFIEAQLEKLANHAELTAGIWVHDDFAGVIGISFSPTASTAEIGYWLAADYQGRGLATVATQCVIDYLFNERAIERIEIHVEPNNLKSCAIPERLGFQLESTVPNAIEVNGRSVDHRIYASARTR